MEFANYQLDWPRENLSVRCFVHDVFNYRYHWHEDEYELNILAAGMLPRQRKFPPRCG